ncbi:Riboflavin synthase eubacterial/eukaryotic (EC [Olavius sp. associated proteobacterium Delta 1]|nr:Riboflavin synthase eubacterial/eukaryotic (EC [Olavius sp. associated proteobacterium Delta 1]
MFTGIIEGLGNIAAIHSSGQGNRVTIEADFTLDQTKIGDSISVSGACLTAVKIEGRRFEVDVSPETLNTTTFDKAKVGDRVNLERAMRFSDRIDGHLVSGHIDGTGIVKQREILGNAVIVTIEVAESLTRYMIAKGSVAVDGISLTINSCDSGIFSISIIPHTAELTTIGFKNSGDRVNIETDMIGKYVERFLSGASPTGKDQISKRSTIDQEYLIKTGFID